MTTLRIAVLLLLASAASARAAGNHEMLAAEQELKLARDHLQDAGTEYQGHRRAAMQHIDDALREIRQALGVTKDRREDGESTHPHRRGGERAVPESGDDD